MIYDYIYVDLDKVISVYSQMTGGIVEVLERNTEHSRSADNKRNYDFKVFKHDAGGTDIEKIGSKEVIKPHHALLKELEEALAENGYLADLSAAGSSVSLRDPGYRAQLSETFCIKAKGRAVIEDYERIKQIAGAFPDVAQLVNKSIESATLSSPEYLVIKGTLDSAQEQLKGIKDRNERASKLKLVEQSKRALTDFLQNASRVNAVERWILDGMKTWIDTFLPGIVNLRIYPFVDRADEHIFGHLKKDCFADVDSSSLHFTYGSFPTEELTLLGIVTSVPREEGEQFKPLAELEKENPADYESVEKGFRGLFRGFDGLENTVRTCRFPRVLVYPLTVYRAVSPIGRIGTTTGGP